MSFSHDVKTELTQQIGPDKHCQMAELAAMMSFSGQFGMVGPGQYMIFKSGTNGRIVSGIW